MGADALRLAKLFAEGETPLEQRFGARLNGDQRRALRAVSACGSGSLGHLHEHCDGCGHHADLPRSCGHRSCPRCQNALTSAWLERQRAKLLPVDYFMVTFTLPAELRALAARQPATVYAALFQASSSTLKGFAERKLRSELGQCAVLHTHNRRLDLHPHVHIVVPGGGIDPRRRQWRKLKGKYLFNEFALARVYRARLLQALRDAGLRLPSDLPRKWVVDVRNVGSGEPALKYLSRLRRALQKRHLSLPRQHHRPICISHAAARRVSVETPAARAAAGLPPGARIWLSAPKSQNPAARSATAATRQPRTPRHPRETADLLPQVPSANASDRRQLRSAAGRVSRGSG